METKWWHHLYIPRRDALAMGLRYEGTLYGLPAWFWGQDDEDEDVVYGTPKMPFLRLWSVFADCLYEFASWFMPQGTVLASPIKIKKDMLLEEAQKVRSQLKV